MKLLFPTIAAITALTIPLSTSAPNPERSQSVPIAELLVIKAADANVRPGQRVGVGQTIRTNGPRVVDGRLSLGGSAEATLWAWGVRRVVLSKSSTLSIRSYAICFGGGRILELNLKGEGYIQTRPLTQACSAVKVCLGVGRGCVALRSSARVREFRDDEYVVGVTEGQGLGQDADGKLQPVPILAGQYSLMSADGAFSPAKTVQKSKGYRVLTRTKAVQSLQALDGYQLMVGGQAMEFAQIPVGVPFEVRSPLD
jgi:hypothetical protein